MNAFDILDYAVLGAEQIYEIMGKRKYYDYIKAWVDFHLKENGD